MIRSFIVTAVLTAGLATPGFTGNCSTSATASHATDDIVATASAAGSFTTLVAAVEAAGLAETLKGDGPFTVFAPTDEAFAKLPEGTVEALIGDPERLREILLYHVVAGKVTSEQVVALDRATTASGADLDIEVADGTVRVNDANVVKTDIETSNGVIHVVDTGILPRG